MFFVEVAFRRHHHDLQRRLDERKPLHGRKSVHAWHVAVEEDDVEVRGPAQGDGGVAVTGLGDLAIEDGAAQDLLHDLAHGRGIVDDEDLRRRGNARIGLDDADGVAGRERLEQEFVGAQLDRHVDRLGGGRSGHQRHEGLDTLFAGRPERLGAGEFRHVHVDEGEIDVGAVEQRQALAAIVGAGETQRQLRRSRRFCQDVLADWRVVRNQHRDGALHDGSSSLADGSPCLHRRQPGYPDRTSTDGWLAGSPPRETKFRRGEQSETATV